jgi:hypothetical protein
MGINRITVLTHTCTYSGSLPHKEKETGDQHRKFLRKALRRLRIPELLDISIKQTQTPVKTSPVWLLRNYM